MRVDIFFDPVCPWCWITARWLLEAAPRRDVEVLWRSFSLAIKNREREIPEKFAVNQTEGLRALRVVEAVRQKEGDGSVEPLYTEYGRRYHHDRVGEFDHGAILAARGLDPGLAAAADDEEWDLFIEASMEEALSFTGDDVGVPLLVFDGTAGIYGPIISSAPTGEAAAELFDRVAALTLMPAFFELKRIRNGRPEVGPRP